MGSRLVERHFSVALLGCHMTFVIMADEMRLGINF